MDGTQRFGLDGRVAIITGAGSGIGEASAKLFASAGASVIVADIDKDNAERVAGEIVREAGTAVARHVDVADAASFQAVVDSAVTEFGHLDVLVNNAGIMIRTPLVDVSAEEFDKIISVNLKGPLYGSQAAARVMKPGSVIINVLSTIIDFSTQGTGSYAASKKGAEALTRTFAVELGAAGIRVNGVAPGWTESGITRGRWTRDDGSFDQDKFEQLADKMASSAPLNTIAEPIDSAYAVLYLASDAARRVTGHIVRVNGGASMA